jgi:hypothetical protein
VIWQNPWAWLGVATLALPVLIHLLGRGHARVQPFPSLRFLERSRLLPTRRTRIHDLALLLVRLGILMAAVAALAQPLLLTRGRTQAVRRTLSRAIVLDTSASMHAAADTARREAVRLAAEAQTSVLLETARPSAALAGAAEWLARQEGRREVVVVSDFQLDALTAADVATVPAATGVRFARVAHTPEPIEVRSRSNGGETTARVALDSSRSTVEWTRSASSTANEAVLLLTGSPDDARAAAGAAASVGVRLPFGSTRAVAVVFPDYARRLELSAKPIALPWLTTAVAALRADSLLASAASSASATSTDTTGLVVARDRAGRPIVVAKQADIEGTTRLLLFVDAPPATVLAAALIASVDRARSIAPPLAELDPAATPEATLASWQRDPSDAARPTSNTQSDGRWLWALALLLLGVETLLRRTKREAEVVELVRDRAA